MIKRLREAYTEDELKEIYAVPHRHYEWPDHVIRVDRTIEVATRLLGPNDRSGADLSCGDGDVLRRCPQLVERVYGDVAPGYEITGPIERTISEIDPVDIFFLCETAEHLDDYDTVLRRIRGKTKKLILSTPIGEHTDDNPEHYWGWDKVGMESILISTGFQPIFYEETDLVSGWYQFQIWGCI